ncbi:MAG: 4-carboxymuconolactone decarboxylase [Solirubrobacteraceae bacterium]|nr:4-carboxymuconolactone decarboxylase [Solirubrobacteraceae bacterium]
MYEQPHVSAHERGMRKLSEYTLPGGGATTHQKLTDDLKDVAPDVGGYIVEFGYRQLYSRPGLTNQQRVLITLASLVTQRTEREIELHVNTGLTAGLTSTEIVERLIHLIPYTGFPRVLHALYIVKMVFAQRQIETPRPSRAASFRGDEQRPRPPTAETEHRSVGEQHFAAGIRRRGSGPPRK